MLNLIPLLINAVPSIAGLFGKEDQANSLVDKAKKVLGVGSNEALEAKLSSGLTELDIERLRIELEYHRLELEGLTKAAELNTSLKLADVNDKQSARAREIALGNGSLGNYLMYGLAGLVTLINAILVFLAFYTPEALNNPGVMVLVGSHTGALTLVLSYFFGSSVANNPSLHNK